MNYILLVRLSKLARPNELCKDLCWSDYAGKTEEKSYKLSNECCCFLSLLGWKFARWSRHSSPGGPLLLAGTTIWVGLEGHVEVPHEQSDSKLSSPACGFTPGQLRYLQR